MPSHHSSLTTCCSEALSSLSLSVFVFLCISTVDLQQEMSDVMKEAWDAESKLREIGQIIKGVIK
jgi:hypothetical protein